jgi:hypothetical protein
MNYRTAVLVIVGIAICNGFIVADWIQALDRTAYQAIAIFTYVICEWFDRRRA